MKILMTTDTAGGVWHYALDLAEGLLKEQVQVVLISMGPSPVPSQIEQVKKRQKRGLQFYHRSLRLEWMEDPWEDVAVAAGWIRKIYDREKPDLLHFNNYAHVAMGWEVPVLLTAHSCMGSWWQSVKNEPLPPAYGQYFQTVKNSFLAADAVVFPSNALLEACQDIYGQINSPKVIYNGLSFTRTPAISEFSSKMPIIFSMGRLWDEAKNVELLLRAAPYIGGEIFIAGEKGKDLECPRNVRYLGKLTRKQVFNWLKISAIYVLPVKYEPFGLSFLEAASFQCALVGGNIPSMKEIWGESMTYIDPEDPKDLAKSCNELLHNPDLCNLKGEEAYRRGKIYSLQKKKENYLETYTDLMHKITAPI
ncbi:MAG TPA: glycosyltransferase family 4 protein [Cyclobacteriaceae bacterium]|nr:glycosyltransferase family 4 protein [Cyclobacteriaceae bacterium]